MATENTHDGKDNIMTGYVSCPIHVRSANLGTLTVLVDLRTGQVDTLLGWAHHVWSALARTGDSTIAATAIDGASADQVIELVRQLHVDRLLDVSPEPRPWMIPDAPATMPSWGTREVSAGILRPGRTAVGTTVLAGVALSSVLVARHVGRQSRSFARIGAEGRGRGLAREATLLTLDYGFHITNLRAIWLKVLERNTAGIRAYEGAGFKPVGRMRRAGYWLGAECDEIIMDALRDEFPGPSTVRQLVEGD
jgi:diamine N-acetyltransferase